MAYRGPQKGVCWGCQKLVLLRELKDNHCEKCRNGSVLVCLWCCLVWFSSS